jgi:hypothetical protein
MPSPFIPLPEYREREVYFYLRELFAYFICCICLMNKYKIHLMYNILYNAGREPALWFKGESCVCAQ